MSRKKLNPSEGELLASAKDAIKWKKLLLQGSENPEEGFYTSKQIAEMIGMKSTRTSEIISEKIEAGLCEMKEFRVRINGKIFVIPHYKIIEQDEDL
jgi:DNA replication protein DnaD